MSRANAVSSVPRNALLRNSPISYYIQAKKLKTRRSDEYAYMLLKLFAAV
jgi:hypothetical protein